METARRQEDIKLKIKPLEVKSEFDNFEANAQEDFVTEENRLSSYARLVGKVSIFFRQPGIDDLDETKEIVNFLFYNHSSTSHIPIKFFIRVRDRLFGEVLGNGSIPSGSKEWQHELSVIREEFTREAQESFGFFIQEKKARERIDELLALSSISLEDSEIQDQLTTLEAKKIQIKNTAIEALSQNKDLAPDISRITDFVNVLKEVQRDDILSSPDSLRDTLAPYSDLFPRDISLSDLHLRAAVGQKTQVGKALSDLEFRAESPDFMWDMFVKKGYVPPEILEGVEEIVTLAQLQETSKIAVKMSKEEKARHLAPFLQRGISAGLILEIVEGRYDLPDNLIVKQVDSFLHFWDVYEENVKPKNGQRSLKRKLVISAAVGMVVLIVSNSSFVPPSYSSVLQDSSQSEQAIAQPQQMNATEHEDVPGIGQEKFSRPGMNDERQQSIEEDAKDFKKDKETVLWRLSGQDLSGYYRRNTASDFDLGRQGWNINGSVISLNTSKVSSESDINLSGKFTIESQRVPIPTKNGYIPNKSSFRMQGNTGDVSLGLAVDGNYFLNFSPRDVGRVIRIWYSLGAGAGAVPAPTEQELKDMREKIVSIDDIKFLGDIYWSYSIMDFERVFTELVNRQGLSQLDKARLLEDYVRNHLEYSLDSTISDDYHRASDSKDFIFRILADGRADCDVANTVLIALLRAVDIPSREVIGFSNTGSVVGESDKKLVETEAHGWVEAYIDGKWVTLDGTPSVMDWESLFALRPSELIQALAEMPEILKETALPALEFYLALDAIALAAFGAGTLLKRRNDALALRLADDVRERTRRYFGRFYTEEFADIEINDIKGPWPQIPKEKLLKYGLPLGFVRLFTQSILYPLRLERLRSIYKRGNSVPQADSAPDELKFFTEVLGYEEREGRKMSHLDAFRSARQELRSEYHNEAFRIFGDNFGSWTLKSLGRSRKIGIFFGSSFDEQKWIDLKREITDTFYDEYTRVTRRIRVDARPILTKEQFESGMEILFHYTLVFRQTTLEKNKAMQSVRTNSFGWLKN